MDVVRLEANRPPERFYRGGAQIAGFRSIPSESDRMPEDWVGSVTPLNGESLLGRTRLDGGMLLADAIAADPVGWLGEEHVAVWGDDPALLVKLLDAGQRLPVHIHPSADFAGERLGAGGGDGVGHGKTEAWYLLAPASIHLGFSREVSASEAAEWVRTQDVAGMLAAMNRFDVGPGDAVLVPAGLPHAIGEGAFLIEVQEPTDLSILLEWRDFAIDGSVHGHLGLGFDVALLSLDRSAWDAGRLASLIVRGDQREGELLATAAAPFFRAERHVCTDRLELDAGYGVVVVVSGNGMLGGATSAPLEVSTGSTILTPHGAGALSLEGELEIIRCRPPRVPNV